MCVCVLGGVPVLIFAEVLILIYNGRIFKINNRFSFEIKVYH